MNINTGRSAVREVLRVDRVHEGEYLDELPDVVVIWRGDAPINGLRSPRIGEVKGRNFHERTGSHRPYGFLLAAGNHIASKGRVEGGSIMDIAPTILYLMGEPVPKDMDGQVMLHIIDDVFKQNNPVRYC